MHKIGVQEYNLTSIKLELIKNKLMKYELSDTSILNIKKEMINQQVTKLISDKLEFIKK